MSAKFDKDSNVQKKEDGYFLTMDLNKYMVDYIDDRFLNIEIILNRFEGLKVPNSALIDKEVYMLPKEYVLNSDGNTSVREVKVHRFDESATEGEPSDEVVSVIIYKTDDDYYAIAQSNACIYASEISQVYDLINQERANVGVASVAYDPTLTIMASHRAAENADATFFLVAGGHHRRPFEIAENTFKEAKTICYYYGQYGSFGEVMGKGQRTPQGIVSGWHNSQAHYNCMVSSSYTRVGIGVADGSDGKRYWVAIFMN